MKDFMYVADSKSVWRDFAIAEELAHAETLPDGTLLLVYEPAVIADPIGAVVVEPAVWDYTVEPPVLVSEAVMDERYHINIRLTDDYVPKLIRAVGDVPPMTTGVTWVDPTTVETPHQVWLGGMDYYAPSPVTRSIKKRK